MENKTILIIVHIFMNTKYIHGLISANKLMISMMNDNMAAQSFIRSELLCFVQNNISNRVREHIVTSVCGFFTLEEVLKAKDLLFEVAERCKSVSTGLLDLPRNKSRVAEDGRAKAYVNDMLNLWEVLDTAKASLPSFGAVDMKRYPPVALADSDMFGLMVNVLDVYSQRTSIVR